jgi:hypothetical protein
VEQRPLREDRLAGVARAHRQLEPRVARQPHLGTQPEQPRLVDLLHAPPVQRLPDVEVVGMAPTAPQARDRR